MDLNGQVNHGQLELLILNYMKFWELKKKLDEKKPRGLVFMQMNTDFSKLKNWVLSN